MTSEQRLTRLERTSRRWRWAASAMALLLAAFAGMGQVGQAPKELVLEKLTISDGKGGPTILLMSAAGIAGIEIFDQRGHTRINASVEADDSSHISHYDATAKDRIVTGTYSNGLAVVSHIDANEKARIVTGTRPNGPAEIVHRNTNGKKRIVAGTNPDGWATTDYLDTEGNVRILTGTGTDGAAGTEYSKVNRIGQSEVVHSLP